MKNLLIVIIFVFIFSSAIARNDEIVVSSYVSKTELSMDETLNFTIEIDSKKDINAEPFIPQLTGLQIINQSSSSSTSIEYVNGKYSKSISKKFIYTLEPLKVGEFIIPPILVKYKNKDYYTKIIKIKINPSKFDVKQKVTSPKGSGKEIFLEAICGKNEVFIGEPVIVSYKLYSRKNLVGINAEKFPEFPGFLKEETYQAKSISYSIEVKDGLKYYCYRISEFTLFSTFSDKFIIEPMELICTYEVKSKSFFDFGTTKRVKVKSNKIIINSKEIPLKNQPLGFSGAVGNFYINSKLSTNEIKVGESITLTATISGEGNIKMFEPPVLPKINNIETFSPEVSDILTNFHKTQGKKIIKYLLIPTEQGDYEIPKLTFSYFDTNENRYKLISTSLLKFSVQKSDKSINKQYYITPKGIDIHGLDICFIRTNNTIKDFSFIYQHFIYWLLVVLSLLSIGFAYIYRLEKNKRLQDKSYYRWKIANKILQKEMVEVKNAISVNEKDKFFVLAENTLKNYIANKFNISQGAAKINDITDILKEKGVDDKLICDVKNFLIVTDQARFSGKEYSSEEIEKELINLKDIIKRLSKVRFRRLK